MTSEAGYRDLQYSRMLAVLGSFIAFGVGVAVGAVYGPVARLVVWILLLVALGGLLLATRVAVTVDARGVGVGRAFIDWGHISSIEVLTGPEMRAAITTGSHPTDYLRLRGTASGARVWVDDRSDPHRAWVVSVRRPDALRSALDVLGVRHGR